MGKIQSSITGAMGSVATSAFGIDIIKQNALNEIGNIGEQQIALQDEISENEKLAGEAESNIPAAEKNYDDALKLMVEKSGTADFEAASEIESEAASDLYNLREAAESYNNKLNSKIGILERVTKRKDLLSRRWEGGKK